RRGQVGQGDGHDQGGGVAGAGRHRQGLRHRHRLRDVRAGGALNARSQAGVADRQSCPGRSRVMTGKGWMLACTPASTVRAAQLTPATYAPSSTAPTRASHDRRRMRASGMSGRVAMAIHCAHGRHGNVQEKPVEVPMKIRARCLVLALVLSGTIGGACAQDFVFGWNPRTGDVWVDQTLGDINAYGGRYRESFIDELVRYHGAPRDYVTTLLVQERWAPGDVYYACAIAQIVGRSCRYVAEEWERDHGQGWGALAQRMGIKPGSDEF